MSSGINVFLLHNILSHGAMLAKTIGAAVPLERGGPPAQSSHLFVVSGISRRKPKPGWAQGSFG